MYIYLEDAKWVRQIYILLHSSFFKKTIFQFSRKPIFKRNCYYIRSQKRNRNVKSQCSCHSHIKCTTLTSFSPAIQKLIQ